MKFYGYKRVNTEKQDIGRQTDALNNFQLNNNITIDEVFTDYYTGKTFNRENYKIYMIKLIYHDFDVFWSN